MATDNIKESLIVLTILFEVVGSEVIQQTTQPDGNATQNITCQFKILNTDLVKKQFDDFLLVDKARLVFFNIDINQDFLNITSYDNIHENGILRWIWVAESQLFILSYPIDLDGITLQLTKSAERTVYLAVNATINIQEHNASNYTICIQSLYQTIFDIILDRNKTTWTFCHRYFEGQYWKKILYFLMGSWLGYDFECFNAFCADTECAEIVQKGTVNIIIDICILLLCLNLPLFYLFLPRRQNICSNQVMNYYKGECPYSFARLFLHLNKNTQVLNVRNRRQTYPFIEWIKELNKDSNFLKPEAKILSFFCFILLGVYVFENGYLRQAISDFDKYTEIYHPYYVSLDSTENSTSWNVIMFLLTSIPLLPVLLAHMSYYGQSKNTFLSLNPFGIIDFDQIVMQHYEYAKFTGYTQFALKFLNRISFFFKKELWIQTFSLPSYLRKIPKKLYPFLVLYFLVISPLNLILYTSALLLPMIHFIADCFLLCPVKLCCFFWNSDSDIFLRIHGAFIVILESLVMILYFIFAFRPYFLFVVQFAFRLIVYTIFVAGPLFSTSVTSYHFWAISVAALIYMLKYTITFHNNYKYLLKKIIKLKNEVKEEKHSELNETEITRVNIVDASSSNIIDESADNIQNIQSSFEWNNADTTAVPVELFDKIAREFVPLNVQLWILFLKLFFTGLFLYVTFDSMNNGGNENFLTSQIPLVITVVMPAIAERLCSPSNLKDDIRMNEKDIKHMIANYEPYCHDTDQYTSMQSPPQTIEISCHSCNLYRHVFSKHFILICPIIYTFKNIITSIFVCCTSHADDIQVEYCPEDIQCCSCDVIEEHDESRPINDNRDGNNYDSISRA